MKEITAGIEELRKEMAPFIDEETEFEIKQQTVLLGKLKTQMYMWRSTKAANSISMGDKIKAELRNEKRVFVSGLIIMCLKQSWHHSEWLLWVPLWVWWCSLLCGTLG